MRDDDKVWPSIVRYLADAAQAEIQRRTKTQPIQPHALERGPGAAAGGDASGKKPAPSK